MSSKPYKSAFLLLLSLLSSCKPARTKALKLGGNIIGLASPIEVKSDTTRIRLSDYFLYPDSIRGVQIPENLRSLRDGNSLYLIGQPKKILSHLRIKTVDNQYDIPVKKREMQPQRSAKPVLHSPEKISLDSVWIQADQPVTFAVYYENHRIPLCQLTLTPKSLRFALPPVRTPKPTAALRIYAYNAAGLTVHYLLVSLGKRIVDPSLYRN